MKFESRYLVLLAMVSVLMHANALLAADPDDFMTFNAEDLPGRLYVPPEALTSERPVIVFLHGAGETGTNNVSQVNQNIDNLLAAAKERGAYLYAPQATRVVGGIFNWNDITRTDNVMTMINQIVNVRNGDPDRVYLTGLSMGGGGTSSMASRNPERFAATVPIASVRTATDFDAANMIGTPTWAFHARNDAVVSKDRSREVVDGILSAAGKPSLTYPPNNDRETLFEFSDEELQLNYTEYPTGGHAIWSRVYDTPEMYDWMFAQAVPEPSSAGILLAGATLLAMSTRRLRHGKC